MLPSYDSLHYATVKRPCGISDRTHCVRHRFTLRPRRLRSAGKAAGRVVAQRSRAKRAGCRPRQCDCSSDCRRPGSGARAPIRPWRVPIRRRAPSSRDNLPCGRRAGRRRAGSRGSTGSGCDAESLSMGAQRCSNRRGIGSRRAGLGRHEGGHLISGATGGLLQCLHEIEKAARRRLRRHGRKPVTRGASGAEGEQGQRPYVSC
jgi:hypothetical protein